MHAFTVKKFMVLKYAMCPKWNETRYAFERVSDKQCNESNMMETIQLYSPKMDEILHGEQLRYYPKQKERKLSWY